jgi:hypothetical protein
MRRWPESLDQVGVVVNTAVRRSDADDGRPLPARRFESSMLARVSKDMGSISTAVWSAATVVIAVALMLTAGGCGTSQEPLGELTRESPCPMPTHQEGGGRLPALKPQACLLAGRRLSLTLIGSGSCKPRPVEMRVESHRVLRLAIRPDVGSGHGVCSSDLRATHTTLKLPAGVAAHPGLRVHVVDGDGSGFWLEARPRSKP